VIGLADSELEMLVNGLKKDERIKKAVVFGSRAKGNYRLYSDIDLAVFGDLPEFGAAEILRELEELPLCQKIDVLDYARIRNVALKQHIDRVGITILDREAVEPGS